MNRKALALPELVYYYGFIMTKMLGYMVTWTTYGTWLQGDKRGCVKDGQVIKKNEQLRQDNEQRLAQEAVRFGAREKEAVKQAIQDEAEKLDQTIYSIAVCSNHVHIVVDYNGRPIEDLVRRYKNAGYFALRERELAGRVWTRGYDKRFCFDEKALCDRIDYVQRHN